MNPKLKKDIKEWAQLIGMALFGSFVLLYQQGYIFSDKEDDKTSPAKTEKVVQNPDSATVAQRDTVAMQVLRDAKQLKR